MVIGGCCHPKFFVLCGGRFAQWVLCWPPFVSVHCLNCLQACNGWHYKRRVALRGLMVESRLWHGVQSRDRCRFHVFSRCLIDDDFMVMNGHPKDNNADRKYCRGEIESLEERNMQVFLQG